TRGHMPDRNLQRTEADADVAKPHITGDQPLACITRTTLSVGDAAEIIAALKARFPGIEGPKKEDICYATTSRQGAVKAIAARCDAMLVIGAPNSSNSLRLVEVAKRAGCDQIGRAHA